MSEDDRTQCLLFVVAGKKSGSLRRSSRSSAQSLVKGYALLPHSFIKEHPEVFELFSRNDIGVITNTEDDPSLLSAFKNDKFVMHEMQLLFETPENGTTSSHAPDLLFVLVHRFDREVIGLLLTRDVSILELSESDKTGFISAVDADNLEVMKTFLTSGPVIDYQHFKGGNVLHIAVKRGQDALVKLLLESGADVNAERPDGMTPLHLAAKKGLLQIAEVLLQHGADANAGIGVDSIGGCTPMVFAYRNRDSADCNAVLRLLLESGADINIKFNDVPRTPLIPETALHQEMSLNFKTETTILYIAVWDRRLEDVALILSYHPDVNNEYNNRAFQHIFLEQFSGFADIFIKMTQCGFKINVEKVEDTNKVLYAAIHKNCFGIVQEMLQERVSVNDVYVSRPFLKKVTPILEAARYAREDMIQLFLDHGADINVELDHRTPMCNAVESCNMSVVKLLMANGANFRDRHDVICRAAAFGDVEIIEHLLLNGASLKVEDKYIVPIRCAAYGGHLEAIEMFFKFGAQLDFELDRAEAFRNAVSSNHPEVLQVLLNHSFPNVQLVEGTKTVRTREHIESFYSFRLLVASKILVQHMIKLESANVCVFDQNLMSYAKGTAVEDFDNFRNSCEAEMRRLKSQVVGSAQISFYDILIQKTSSLACFARDKSFTETMESYDYESEFPIYASILNCQFKKALQRAELMNLGKQICNTLFNNFEPLPNELKDKIINYLSNCDILILNSVCPICV